MSLPDGTYVPWSRLSRFFGDGQDLPPIGNPYFMGPYKPLRNEVDGIPETFVSGSAGWMGGSATPPRGWIGMADASFKLKELSR